MPSVDENREQWQRYEWPADGEEWSEAWGGARAQWWGTIFPRIAAYLPAATIVEIAPGYGRWTQFLLHLGRRLVAVDLAPNCIEHCRQRFAGWRHASFVVNDGRSLPGVADGTVDFAFSFDSLVHVELEVLVAYLEALAVKLAPDGVAFLHHANLGALRAAGDPPPDPMRTHWRAPSASATAVAEACRRVGLLAIRQEIVDWGGCDDLDCFSTIVRPGSRWAFEPLVVTNRALMREADLVASRAKLYLPAGPGAGELVAPLPWIGLGFRSRLLTWRRRLAGWG